LCLENRSATAKSDFSCVETCFFSRKSPLRIGSPNTSTEVVHRPRSWHPLHFDIRNKQQICSEKQFSSARRLRSEALLERWPQVCRVKITFTNLPTNRSVSTTKISMKCVVNWIPLRIRVRSRNTQPQLNNKKNILTHVNIFRDGVCLRFGNTYFELRCEIFTLKIFQKKLRWAHSICSQMRAWPIHDTNGTEHIELPAKLLDFFLRNNKRNINQNTSKKWSRFEMRLRENEIREKSLFVLRKNKSTSKGNWAFSRFPWGLLGASDSVLRGLCILKGEPPKPVTHISSYCANPWSHLCAVEYHDVQRSLLTAAYPHTNMTHRTFHSPRSREPIA